jgi:hypothetical protein
MSCHASVGCDCMEVATSYAGSTAASSGHWSCLSQNTLGHAGWCEVDHSPSDCTEASHGQEGAGVVSSRNKLGRGVG